MNAVLDRIEQETRLELETPTSLLGLAEFVRRATLPEPARPIVSQPTARNRSQAETKPYDLD